MWLIYYFSFGRNYDVLKSKSPCILLKNITESKIENTKHVFGETDVVLQAIKESQIKSKTAMSRNSLKEKEGIFCTVYFVRRKSF